MCGIVGYTGKKQAKNIILDGLTTLEYRGYDSAGIALGGAKPQLFRAVGEVKNTAKKARDAKPATNGIGHTRWATHGQPSVANAHPHPSRDGSIHVVHNGIIENYQELKAELEQAGYEFTSETDTEVVAHLIQREFESADNFFAAFESAIAQLVGAYAIVAISSDQPGELYVARLSSPLLIGVGDDEHFIASDASALIDHTQQVIHLDDFDIAKITASEIRVKNIQDQLEVDPNPELLDADHQRAALGDYAHFMLKEIYEAPDTVVAASRGRLDTSTHTVKLGGLESVSAQLRHIDRLIIVACGTSYFAGMLGEYLLEELAELPVEVQLASEFKYRSEPLSRGTAVLAISQSGETADTIAALKKVENYGILKLGVVNVVGSTIARMTDAGVYCHAGPEIAVASTKAFVAQVTVLTQIALLLGQQRSELHAPLIEALDELPTQLKRLLEQTPHIEKLAKKYSGYQHALFIGRGHNYPVALESALKLKEISYIHAEGVAAGEMKHGTLALIDEDFPTIAIATAGQLYDKTLSNIEEVKARGGPVLALVSPDDTKAKQLADDTIEIPNSLEQTTPLLNTVALQLFAYCAAVELDHNVDRPRNLAKSVTVE